MVALYGVDPGLVGDVDVLVSLSDARDFCRARHLPCLPGTTSDRFRSAIFARWLEPPLPVEIMAGFEVATNRGWQAVVPTTRQVIATDGGAIYVPDRIELATLLRTFGRPKDLARAALLEAPAT